MQVPKNHEMNPVICKPNGFQIHSMNGDAFHCRKTPFARLRKACKAKCLTQGSLRLSGEGDCFYQIGL